MTRMHVARSALLMGCLAVALGCGPLVTLPGGELSGSVTPTPSDWSFSDSVETVQLETRPGDPYSVNVWGVGLGRYFFIAAADPENRWASYMKADPNVRLRIADDLYELRAELAESPAQRSAVLAAIKRKYDRELSEEETSRAVLFRLGPR